MAESKANFEVESASFVSSINQDALDCNGTVVSSFCG